MENIAIPLDLTAFALSPSCCEGQSQIAPITQPNYMGLRLDDSLIQHDLVDQIDFHLTSPATLNPRLTDLGTSPPQLRNNRLGVYLHWSLPRLYRTGTSSADTTKQAESAPAGADPSSPIFRKVPNRWLIVRRLNLKTSEPSGKVPDFQSWVIESDRKRKINDIEDDVDLETDVSPFVDYDGDPNAPDALQTQAEVFIGKRNKHSGWASELSTGQPQGWSEDASGSAKFVDLTIMNASNPLFPDYVPQNGSVFSLVDSFQYKDHPSDTEYQHLTKAEADYFVIGWHSDPKDDPLSQSGGGSLESRLSTLKLELDVGTESKPDAIAKNLLGSNENTRVLLYGAIYSVKYDLNTKPRSLADEAAKKFTNDIKMEPLSMGTTALDAILTFLEAHRGAGEAEKVFGPGSAGVANDVLNMAALLYAADDSYDSRVKAQDLLYTNNYAKADGGSQWHFDGKSGPGKPPSRPSDQQLQDLADLNEAQANLDTSIRLLKSTRWQLFAEWWKYVSDRSNVTQAIQDEYISRVNDLKMRIDNLVAAAAAHSKTVDGLSGGHPYKRSSGDSYFIRKDPTLCVAGLQSGWPTDFMDPLKVHMEHQLTELTDEVEQKVSKIFGAAPNPVPQAIGSIAKRLLAESLNRTRDSFGSPEKGFKLWGDENGDANPFQPLFIEWETLYYHVDRSKWNVGVRPSPVGHPHSQVRYGTSKTLYDDPDNQKDYRYLSGRVLILPQPIFSLEAIVLQVLDSAGPELTLTEAQVKQVKDNIRKLQFISAPLSGLTEHLLTRFEGTHVKPNVRTQGQKLKPLGAAATASTAIGMDTTVLGKIDSESALTPYGNLLNFSEESYPKAPFKGVTHGQMMFKKLNIVDKFGQAICLPTPKPRPRKPELPPPSIHPCLSDFLTPDIINGHLNTIYHEPASGDPEPVVGEWPLCRFIQMTPSINQNARINASFVNRNYDKPGAPPWHETSDDKPESPIFGWIIVNYQDYGLQFFLPDGTFYREVRVGGPTGTNAGTKWLPFDPPGADKAKATSNPQLDELISRLTDPATADPTSADSTNTVGHEYVQEFFDMINAAIKTMPFPPSDYSAYANSIVGKPLALVNVGWSLELSVPAIKAQNTLGQTPADEAAELASYKFPFKIGDAERPFDGVVGFYFSDNTTTGTTSWDKLYTYFPSSVNKHLVEIEPSNFPTISPYYIDPNAPTLPITDAKSQPTKSYTEARTARYLVTTMLIDPYTPIHAFSPILPIKSLQLPPWTIQQAFTRMTAFFRLGPQLLSSDVPIQYDSNHPLQPDTWNTSKATVDSTTANLAKQGATAPLRLPVNGKKGLWQWLQPYDVVDAESGENVTRYNSLDVGEEDTKIRKDPPPYTFVEGYLQLARPLLKGDVSGAAGGM